VGNDIGRGVPRPTFGVALVRSVRP